MGAAHFNRIEHLSWRAWRLGNKMESVGAMMPGRLISGGRNSYSEGLVMPEKTWFVTGASRGLGREWTRAALNRGDKVAATTREISALRDLQREFGDSLLTIQLDVTDRGGDFAAVAYAHDHFGHLDIVVNNAGYGHGGFIEELSEREVRDQMEVNFFGALWIIQAALPYLRGQGYGHIVQVSSGAGLTSAPDYGAYCASKFAIEGVCEALAQEMEPFGIHVTLIEPGPFATGFSTSSAKHSATLPPYVGLHEDAARATAKTIGEPGDPSTAAIALLAVVDAGKPPLRVLFGASMLRIVTDSYDRRLAEWEDWNQISIQAQG